MNIKTQRVTLAYRIVQLLEVLLTIEYYQRVVVVVVQIRRVHQRVFHHKDSSVFLRRRELERVCRVVRSRHLVSDFFIRPLAELKRINHAIYRMYRQV